MSEKTHMYLANLNFYQKLKTTSNWSHIDERLRALSWPYNLEESQTEILVTILDQKLRKYSLKLL